MVQICDRFLEIQDLCQPPPEEQLTLQQLWDAGKLQRHARALERFCLKNQAKLRELSKTTFQQSLVEAAKLLVLQHKIVDHLAESFDQLKAIESEIWIQGERGNFNRDQIAVDWTLRHAAAWREWRLKEYLYAVERMGESLHALLEPAA